MELVEGDPAFLAGLHGVRLLLGVLRDGGLDLGLVELAVQDEEEVVRLARGRIARDEEPGDVLERVQADGV